MKKLCMICFVILLIPVVALGAKARMSRQVVFSGEPVKVYIRAGVDVHIALPEPVGSFSAPIGPNKIKIRQPEGRPRALVFRGVDPPGSFILTIPTTTHGHYTIELIRDTSPDTWVDILNPPPSPVKKPAVLIDKELSNIALGYTMASTSPLRDGIMAMWYTQWGRSTEKAIYGVDMYPMRNVMIDNETQRVQVVWRYEGRGLYGFTLMVTNKLGKPTHLNIQQLRDPHADLYSISVEGFPSDAPDVGMVPAGGSVLMHLTYVAYEGS